MGSKNIFLSYSTVDDDFVNKVYKNIKAQKPDLKIFKFNIQDYKSLQSWAKIDSAINEANVYFVFISKISLQSKAVIAELYAAFHKSVNSQNEKFKIIPIIIDDYTNWKNHSPFSSYPLLNSIHRIEDFTRNYISVSNHIINNIERDQWPSYKPNIKGCGYIINTSLDDQNSGKKINCKILLLILNINVDKITFFYRLKSNTIYKKSRTSIGMGPNHKFDDPVTFANKENQKFSKLRILDNEEIDKNEVYSYIFHEGTHYPENDLIEDIRLKYGSSTEGFNIPIIKKTNITYENLKLQSTKTDLEEELKKEFFKMI